MKLQLRKIFLVQRGTKALKDYDFDPGKLNIIIGQGARGKTTIWSIIDYVFCSRESDIDSNIAKAVEWVGVEILTSLGTYVIARRLKEGLDSKSPDFYLKHLEADVYDVDGLEVDSNSNSAAVKGLLDRVCGVEAMTTQADENGQSISFSIRYLLNIIGQDYRTVSDQQHLFAFKAPQQWQTLTKYFASIIGVEADALNLLRAEKQKDEKALKKFKEEYKRALTLSEQWKVSLKDQLLEAKNLTMIAPDVEIPKDVEKALALVRQIVRDAEGKPMFSYNVEILGELARRVTENRERKAGLELEIAQLQVRIEELESLEKKAAAIHAEALKVKDRMEIAKWVKENWFEYQPGFFRYPYSDGRIADEVRAEIDGLTKKLEAYEKTTLANDKMLQFRNLNLAEKKRLKERQQKLAADVDDLRKEIESLRSRGKLEKDRIDRFESVNNRARELIGNFERTIQLVEGLTDTGALAHQIQLMDAKVASDQQRVDLEKAQVEAALQETLSNMSARAFDIAQGVGLNESFKFANLQFDPEKLDFKILYGDSETYLKSRKSTANHVAFHIGVTAAMEEACVGNARALLPDFVVYDQPTQGRSGISGGENVGESCFVSIAKELAKSVQRCEAPWQPILIDSWSQSTLEKLGDVDYKLVADLDELSGLVPSDWMGA